MYQLEGCQMEGQREKVCMLKKALCGLKQASLSWNKTIHKDLTRIGLIRCKKEPWMYYKVHDQCKTYVELYVDDLFIFSNDSDYSESLQQALMTVYKMQNLGRVQNCLGMRVTHDNDVVTLDQEEYVECFIERFQMSDCSTINTPMEVNFQCVKRKGECDRELPYQQLIGALMQLAVNTRTDILHAVVRLSHYNNCYNEELWKHAKRVLRYLKQTKYFCLTFMNSKLPRLVGHVDADWGGNLLDRRSYSGSEFKYGDSVVSWSSKKQKSVSLSSTESEYTV
jgi:hypothetical protein